MVSAFVRPARQATGARSPAPQGRLPSTRRALAVAGLSVALLAGSLAPAVARPAPASFADLVEDVAPAVVNISVLQRGGSESQPPRGRGGDGAPFPQNPEFREFFERFFDRQVPGGPGQPQGQPQRPRLGAGSGFVVDPEGYVVTNNHVIDGADEITVTLRDGKAYEAELIGADPRTDLALLKVDAEGPLPYVAFGESDDLRPGDWVVAVGNPFGLGGSVTAGIVSARGRDLPGGSLIDFIQIDAPINRGNSGGPTFNSAGEVIGVNTAIYSPNGGSVGIGFAIPSELASQIVDDLRDDGAVERGWLGVRIQPVTPDIAEGFGLEGTEGALVAAVEPGSPADEAGLRAGDVVLSWDGKPVTRVKDLSQLVAATEVEKEAELRIWRDREARTLTVVTGSAPGERQALAPAQPESEGSVQNSEAVLGDTGVTVATLDDEIRDDFDLADVASGVVVVEIAPDSNAARSGLRAGDIIRSIALEPVQTAEQAAERIAELAAAGESVAAIRAARGGSESFFALRLNRA